MDIIKRFIILTLLCFLPKTYRTTRAEENRTCPSTIANGWISRDCNRLHYMTCSYMCNSGCSQFLSSLYCQQDGTWQPEVEACRCEGTRDGADSSAGIVGATIGITAGLMVLVVIMVILLMKRRQVISLLEQRRVIQHSIYQRLTTEITANNEIQSEIPNPGLEMDRANQVLLMEEKYIDYLHPYSSLQLITHTDSTNAEEGPEDMLLQI